MRLSEKLSDVKFSRGVAGYNIKEVDAFLETLSAELEALEAAFDTLSAEAAEHDAEKEKIAQEKNAAAELLSLAESKAKKLLSEAQAASRACERAAEIEAESLRTNAESKAQNRLHAAQVQADGILADAEAAAKEKLETAEQNAAQILAAADRRGRALIAKAEEKTAAEADRYAGIVSAGRAYTASVAELTEKLRGELAALNDRTKPRLDAALALRAAHAASAEYTSEASAPAAQALDVPMPEGKSAGSRTAGGERRAVRAARGADGAPQSVDTPAADGGQEPAVQDFAFAGGRLLDGDLPKSTHTVKPYDNLNVTYAEEDNGFADVEKIMKAGKLSRKDPTDFAE